MTHPPRRPAPAPEGAPSGSASAAGNGGGAEERLSRSELAIRTGTTPEHVAVLEEHGLLRAAPDGTFSIHDVERARLADGLHDRGISYGDLARAIDAGFVNFASIRSIAPSGLTDRTYGDLYGELGLDERWIQRVYAVWGVSCPPADAPARQDDTEVLAILAAVLDAFDGDEERALAGVRPVGENLRRVGESVVRWFRTAVVDAGIATGLPRAEAMARVAVLRDRLAPLFEQLVHRLYRRSLSVHTHQERIHLMEDGLQAFGAVPVRKAADPSIAFLDLSGYVRLTEETGDEAAERLAAVLAELSAEVSTSHGGRAVKYLGDGVMFHFGRAERAVEFGLSALPRAAKLRLPSARMGIHAGPVVFRDGDYFGRTVNVAARITEYARPGEILASEPVATRSGRLEAFRPIGPVLLKGLTEPVTLFTTRPS